MSTEQAQQLEATPAIEKAVSPSSEESIQERLEAILEPEQGEAPPPPPTEDIAPEEQEVDEDSESIPDQDEPGEDLEEIADGITLNAALGLPEDAIQFGEEGQAMVKVTVDGVSEWKNAEELIRGYQFDKANTVKSQELAEQRKAFEAEAEQLRGQFQEQLELSAHMMKAAENQLVGKFNDINWDALKREDQTAYMIKRQEYAEAAQQIQDLQQKIGQQAQEFVQKQQEEQQQVYNQWLTEQYNTVLQRNPTWSDENVRDKAYGEITSFLRDEYNMPQEEIDTIGDARHIQIIQDAMAYRKGQKVTQQKLKKKAPRFQKPGVQQAKSKSSAKQDKLKRFRKSQNAGDLAALLEDRM